MAPISLDVKNEHKVIQIFPCRLLNETKMRFRLIF